MTCGEGRERKVSIVVYCVHEYGGKSKLNQETFQRHDIIKKKVGAKKTKEEEKRKQSLSSRKNTTLILARSTKRAPSNTQNQESQPHDAN